MLIQSLHPLSPLVTHSSLFRTGQLSGSRNQTPDKLSAQITRGLTSEKLHLIIRQMEKLFMPLRTSITWENNSLSSFAVRAEIKSSCKVRKLPTHSWADTCKCLPNVVFLSPSIPAAPLLLLLPKNTKQVAVPGPQQRLMQHFIPVLVHKETQSITGSIPILNTWPNL